MPFKSKSQQRWMYANKPEMAKKWSDHTSDHKSLPEKAKKNPYLFFKFFEKRFHKKAENWKRKLYRIGSLLLQNDEKTLQ